MQICPEHWERLRDEIDKRGLSGFIAQDSKQATELTKRQMEGEASVAEYDPLLGSNWALMHIATYVFGMGAMMMDGDSHRCPACLLEKQDYIALVADSALAEARKRGLVGGTDE